MANNHSTLAGLFTAIANAIRAKTGGTESIVADQFPDAIAAIDTQENLDSELSTQDNLITQIAAALEGKAAGGVAKTTKTINLDWSEDYEGTCEVVYISNGARVTLGSGYDTPSVIEAEGGVVYMEARVDSYYSNNFISLDYYGQVIMATQDGETIYLCSSDEQGV